MKVGMRILLRNEANPGIRLEFHNYLPVPFRVQDSEENEYWYEDLEDAIDQFETINQFETLYKSARVELGKARARVSELATKASEPYVLRKQAEAVEQCWSDIAEMVFSTEVRTPEGAFTKAAGYCAEYSLRLRKQAEAAERAREDGGNG
jgi:benzoyl-CoA reductase/2-hydroxyglutaryl-CoA dehydratase subunit BcrC/BadD/HgdB